MAIGLTPTSSSIDKSITYLAMANGLLAIVLPGKSITHRNGAWLTVLLTILTEKSTRCSATANDLTSCPKRLLPHEYINFGAGAGYSAP